MTFSTQALTGERVLVRGTDSTGTEGTTVLDGSEWAEINSHKAFHAAETDFAAAVEEFFAPLTEAAEKAGRALERPSDPLSVVVLHEEVEGVAARPAEVRHLSHDSMVLRLLDSGDHSRLVWVDGDLEILEVLPSAVAEEPSAVAEEPADEATVADSPVEG